MLLQRKKAQKKQAHTVYVHTQYLKEWRLQLTQVIFNLGVDTSSSRNMFKSWRLKLSQDH